MLDESILKAYYLGLLEPKDIVAWADSVLMVTADVPYWVIEVAELRNRNRYSMTSILEAEFGFHLVTDEGCLMAAVYHYYERG